MCIQCRFEGYTKLSKWVQTDAHGRIVGKNENCTDPRKLFEWVVQKSSDLINHIKFEFHGYQNGSTEMVIKPSTEKNILAKNDHFKYGHCFTIEPTSNMILRQIKSVEIDLKVTKNNESFQVPKFLFQTPGIFNQVNSYTKKAFMKEQYVLEFDIHKQLAKDSKPPCEGDPDYSWDKCIHQHLEKASLAKFGCTTPFGPNKDNICTNITIAKKAFNFYQDSINTQKSRTCPVPCKTYRIRAIKRYERSKGYTRLVLNLNENVLVSEEVFLYSGLSLIAEVGSYIGLFLGVSVNQVSTLLEALYDKAKQMVIRLLEGEKKSTQQ